MSPWQADRQTSKQAVETVLPCPYIVIDDGVVLLSAAFAREYLEGEYAEPPEEGRALPVLWDPAATTTTTAMTANDRNTPK
jgi:hypothetical protein